MRREFASFDVAAVVRELRETIVGCHINNVYQPDSKTLLVKLHKTDKPSLGLILEAGRRLHSTTYILERPSVPPAFCMAMRKYLRNGWLTGVEQHEFERAVVFAIKTGAGNVQLILEIFGDGNILIVGDDGRILQALEYKRMRDRNILRGEVFRFAPPSGRNPLRISREELLETLKSSGNTETVRVIARSLSIGGVYAEELLLRAEIDKGRQCNTLSESEVNAVHGSLRSLLSQVVTGILEPCVVLDDAASLVDVVPFRLKRYERSGIKLQPCGSFNEALDEFYTKITAVEKARAGVKVDQLKREADRLKRIAVDQEKVLTEAAAGAAKNRLIGDTIYAHSVELQMLMDRFSAGRKSGKEWSTIVSEILAEHATFTKLGISLKSFDQTNSMVNVCANDLEFGMSLRETLFENAARFYEQSKRAKQKLAGAKVALEDTRSKLVEAEARVNKAEAVEQLKPAEAMEQLGKYKIRHKEWFEKFRWFNSSDDFLVIAGKDAVTNEVLIKRHTAPEDIVFHADVMGAPFVVIKTTGRPPSESVMLEAGAFAAAFSRGWREGFGSVDVYWVKPEQLSKSGPSGEFVAHGAFAVNGKRNWMRNIPLKVAVGVSPSGENGNIKFVNGPLDAVKTKAKAYVVIVPGNMVGKELLTHILQTLASMLPKDQREEVLKASVENIREYIPYGSGRTLAI